MALTLEQLLKLGVPKEICAAIIAASDADTKATIDGHYVPKEKMDSVLERNKELSGQVSERDAQITKLGGMAGENEKLKEEVAKLTSANAEQKKLYLEASIEKDKKIGIQAKLAADGCIDPLEVTSKFDLSSIVLDKDGNVVGGYESQRDAIKTSKPYYFSDEGTKSTKTEPAENQPAGGWPPGWVRVGQTPPAGCDEPELVGAEAEAIRMVKQMTASSTSSATMAGRAQAHYFGTTAVHDKETETK